MMTRTLTEAEKIEARLIEIEQEYIALNNELSKSLGAKKATQINELIEELRRLINERTVLLDLNRKRRQQRRVSLLPVRRKEQ